MDTRLAWALDHTNRVRELTRDWESGAIQESVEVDLQRDIQIYRAKVIGDPPSSIALALGDVLHHARATLDNLVGVLRGGATDRSAFRIYRDPLLYDLDPLRGGSLHGVPPWALAIMRDCQPFEGNTRRVVGEELQKLHHLAIVDRHRALLLAGVGIIDIDQVWASTSHPGKTEFKVREGGRVLELEYPAEAVVTAHVGGAVLVREDRLRWTGEAARYPFYPSAFEVAEAALWAVGVVLDQVRWNPGRA